MTAIVSELWEDLGWLWALLLGTLLLLIALLSWVAILEQGDWTQFKVDHHCHVVGKMSGSVVTTVGPTFGGTGGVAIGVGSTPDKTGWLCDDGVTYWR